MSSTGAGYDYSCSQYSPDGKIFQLEYANKAVESSGTAIGIKCRDGIVLAVEKPHMSKMLVDGSNKRIFGIEKTTGGVVAGNAADGRQIINRAREESQNYRTTYGGPIIPSILANRLALYVHFFTLHYSLRPFGSVVIFCGRDPDTLSNELYMVDVAGNVNRHFACAAGKGAQAANTELEKFIVKCGGSNGISCKDAVKQLASILHTIRDPNNDKTFELEMSWLSAESEWVFAPVPAELVKEADSQGKQSVTSVAMDESSVIPPA